MLYGVEMATVTKCFARTKKIIALGEGFYEIMVIKYERSCCHFHPLATINDSPHACRLKAVFPVVVGYV